MFKHLYPAQHQQLTLAFSPKFFLALMMAVVFLFVAIDVALSKNLSSILFEGHSVEIASSVFFALACSAWLWLSPDHENYRNWHIPVILALMCLRELDFDKRFTTEGILQLRLYSGPSPVFEKLIGCAVVLLILICGFRLLQINVPRWLRGLREGMAASWLVAFAGILLIVSKSLDGINRKLEPLGISLTSETVAMTTRIEEVFELFVTMALVLAVSYYVSDHEPKTEFNKN